jgi:hypothetical protein
MQNNARTMSCLWGLSCLVCTLYSTRTSTILRSSFNLGGLIPWTGTGSGKSTRASEGSEMTGPGSTGNSESDKAGKV